MYVGNLHKLKVVHDRCVKYDMKDTLKIPSIVGETTADPVVQWGDATTKRDLLVHWSQINLGGVISFQCNTNLFAYEEDMTSSEWVKNLLVNSSEAALSQRVDEKFQQLKPLNQGGIMYLKFLLYEIFCMTNDIVTAFQLFLKVFSDKGLTNTVG